MELVKTIRGFHWVTKIVIALTILLVVLFVAALITNNYGGSGQGTNVLGQGFGYVAVLLAWILVQAFLILLIIIAIYMAIMAVKAWIEKYLNAMLAGQKADREAAAAAVAATNEKLAQMEQKLDRIEEILRKVSE
jgi:glucan phosphoethanolaminetransferase (alkaline phosphatase superfamily)